MAGMSWMLLLPYCAGAVVLVIGVATGLSKTASHPRDADKLLGLGAVCLAVPMAVFGTEHFVFTDSVMQLVPSWIPWHLFWVILVGVCLVAGAIALAARKYAALAAALFGVLLLLFVVLLHIPKVVAAPGDRIAWAVALRDLAFGWGALALAVIQTTERTPRLVRIVLTLARVLIGIPILFFGVEQFLHPEFRPGVPLKQLTPPWIPAHGLWPYVTGVVFVTAGVALVCNWRVRLAATSVGLTLLLLIAVIYVPVVIAKPAAVGDGLNSLVDTLLLAGAAWCLAGSSPKTQAPQTEVAAGG
jgi:uncharacterized membrane protein